MGTESNLARFIAFLESGKVEGYGYLGSGTQSQLFDVIDTYAQITEYIQDQQTLGKLRLCGMPQDHVKRRRPGAGWKFEKPAASLHSMHATQKRIITRMKSLEFHTHRWMVVHSHPGQTAAQTLQFPR